QLYAVLEYGLAPKDVLEEHLRRGYLVKWIKEVLGDEYFTKLYNEGKIKTLDELKNYIKNILKLIK
ncbi:MAG: MarR family transcriptional regulator, partial [Staphylothermus sp.]|nr:MarR family transcriptional regulator [Staphylothermus sp.]